MVGHERRVLKWIWQKLCMTVFHFSICTSIGVFLKTSSSSSVKGKKKSCCYVAFGVSEWICPFNKGSGIFVCNFAMSWSEQNRCRLNFWTTWYLNSMVVIVRFSNQLALRSLVPGPCLGCYYRENFQVEFQYYTDTVHCNALNQDLKTKVASYLRSSTY